LKEYRRIILNIDGTSHRSIWLSKNGKDIEVIDQTLLPHKFEVASLKCLNDAVKAIANMQVRGAPLVGVTAAYGVYLAMREEQSDVFLSYAYAKLLNTRPTAINLKWALDRMVAGLLRVNVSSRVNDSLSIAESIAIEETENCKNIGIVGTKIIREISDLKHGGTVNILTHCNAGWLATVDWGTALAPIYAAFNSGVSVHVWVDETRPRNQGASLTAWELSKHGVDNTVVVDNAGGHLMQHGMVDLCIVGCDRATSTGDVCNKIGTYHKALAAFDNEIPFYVALPHSTIDWTISDGIAEIPIEQRDTKEVTEMSGLDSEGVLRTVSLVSPGQAALNYAFDVTPNRFISGLITERGICMASEQGLLDLYPENKLV
jgi:methylthioribose-1-phosphate isomerase